MFTDLAKLSLPSSSVYAPTTKKTAPDFVFMYSSHSATSAGIFFAYLHGGLVDIQYRMMLPFTRAERLPEDLPHSTQSPIVHNVPSLHQTVR